MAYQNSPSTRPIDSVRLLVGDISTSTASELLADSAYTFFIAQTPNIYDAASLAVQSLANVAAQGGIIRKEVGDLVLVWDYSQLMELSRRFTIMSSLQASPYAGGISVANKRFYEGDADRAKPFFIRKLVDNPAAMDPQGTDGSCSTAVA